MQLHYQPYPKIETNSGILMHTEVDIYSVLITQPLSNNLCRYTGFWSTFSSIFGTQKKWASVIFTENIVLGALLLVSCIGSGFIGSCCYRFKFSNTEPHSWSYQICLPPLCIEVIWCFTSRSHSVDSSFKMTHFISFISISCTHIWLLFYWY